ncbi:aminopeptidase P family protein [Flavitalea sp.]|nr:aminopeptidase P family protein [Flavitalea sp.]
MKKVYLTGIFLVFFLCGLFAQDNDVANDYLSPSFHASRRDSARALMPANSVMVVFAFPTRNFSNDVDYVYHANPDLYYFTGYKEPHSVLFLFKEDQKSADGNTYNELLFIQERNVQAEQWTGKRMGVEGVKTQLKINQVFNGGEFKNHPQNFTGFTNIVMDPLPVADPGGSKDVADLYSLVNQFRLKSGLMEEKEGNTRVQNKLYRQITGGLREIKTEEELAILRKAIEISCIGQAEVMKAIRPEMSEREVQGLHEYVHKKYGAENVGYPSIVGAGNNGCVLHYVENAKLNVGKQMLLMDVGAEYHNYTADVTRTIPANGKFTPEQKAIYEIVYQAQEECFKMCKEGTNWRDVNLKSKEIVAAGLLRLGIISKKEEAAKYYPHGLGHHIGMDVHDRSISPVLKKNMVLTIEPGIYIPENSNCDKKWWGIAVRIEDDILIREKDYELLSTAAPRKIEDIEKKIAEKSILENYTLPPLKPTKKGF